MEERAGIPVTLPVANPTESYWHSAPSVLSDHVSSPSPPSTTDTLIIGSGITGAAIAHFLLCPPSASSSSQQTPSPPDMTMLEARAVTSGATGRNGGHTKAASYRSFLHHASTLGTEAACLIARLELANVRAVHTFAATQLGDGATESRPCQTVDVIYDAAQWQAAKRAVEAMRQAMPGDDAARYELYEAEETQNRFRVSGEGLHGSVAYEAGSISAYRFTTGVLELCVDKGMKLFTETPAISVRKLDESAADGHRYQWVVETPRGQTKARRVVLATNAYTAFLDPRFQESIVPMRGQITAHRPGSKMPKEGLATTYSFVYEGGYEYMIPKPHGTRFAGDIVIGGGLARAPDQGLGEYGTTDDSRLNPAISTYLYETTPRYFGDNWGEDDPDGRVRAEWTGIMGFSPDGLPFVGRVPGEEGLWVSAGFQGHGMVLCWMCARALATMLDGTEEDKRQLGSWFPGAFRVTSARLKQRFTETVDHSTSGPADPDPAAAAAAAAAVPRQT